MAEKENGDEVLCVDEFLVDFSSENLIEARDDTRQMCLRCKRPTMACWCKHLPPHKIPLHTTVHILQHPYEKSRCLQTAEMLVQAFECDHCILYRGKRFLSSKYADLHDIAALPNTLLLFPGANSTELKTFLRHRHANFATPSHSSSISHDSQQQHLQQQHQQQHDLQQSPELFPSNCSHNDKNNLGNNDNNNIGNNDNSICNNDIDNSNAHQSTDTGAFHLLVLDGTWHQAKGILFCNPFLHSVTKVHLEDTGISRYTIRTQPTDQGLSTVESVSLSLSLLENNPHIYTALMAPLEALCRTQLQHGAVVHHSKQRLEQLGLKYPMKDNYKFMSEDEEKKRRKKQRKLNRQMNRLRIKKDQREEWLQQHCLEDPTSAVQKVDGEKGIVAEGRDAGERKNEQKNVLVDELVDDFKKVQIDFKGGDDWKTTNTSDATKDQAISLTFSTNS